MSESKKELMKQIAKPLTFILLLIMICAFLAQYLTGSETLEEYARNNPELAYGSQNEASDTDDTADIQESVENNDVDMQASASDDAGNPAETSSGNTDKASSYNESNDSSSESVKENEPMNVNSERVTYQPGFYYEPLSEDIKQRITGISYPVAESKATETTVPAINRIDDDTSPAVSYDDLCYVRVLYYDFNGKERDGELICNKAIAQDLVEIFYELYRNEIGRASCRERV